MKNIDKLKTMTAEDIATLLVFDEDHSERCSCNVCINSGNCNDECFEGVVAWLNEESGEPINEI